MSRVMNHTQHVEQIVLKLLIAASLSVAAFGAPSSQNNPNDTLVRQLAGKLGEPDKKGVLVMDLNSPDGHASSFGSWFADELSSSLANQDPPVEVISRARLPGALEAQHLSPADESSLKNAIALSKAIGASTVVVGSYGAAENGIGVTLDAFRVSEFEVLHSPKFEIGTVFGKMPLTPDISSHLQVPLDSLRPKDGVYRAGVGGVSVPACAKCSAPSMHVPDIDLQGLLREKPHGGTIVLRFVVTADGRATQITVAHPIGYGLDEQYVKAAKEWEFKPAVDPDDKPVSALWQMTFYINFK
jgi:TonB family protein